MSRLNAILVTGLLAASLKAHGQPSPPLPPGISPPPLVIPFGGPPVVGISEKQIAEHLVNLALPANYFLRTATANIPASDWNATAGAKLRVTPVQIGTLATATLESVSNPALTNCVQAYFDAGGVEAFEVAANGEIETAWIGEVQHQRYLELSKAHPTNGWANGDPDQWTIRYVNQRAQFALNVQRLGLLRIWNRINP